MGIIFTALLNGCLALLQLQFLRRLKIKLAVGMTSRFVWHILRLPLGFYEQRFSGEISSRVGINDSIANTLSGRLATSAIALVSVCFYLIVMLQYDAILTSVAIAFVLMNLAALQWVRRQRVNANKRLIQEYGKVSGVGISGLQSIETLKASGLESDFFSRWTGYYAKAINARQSLEVSNQILGILPSFLSAIAQMLILVVGGVRVMDGVLSIGMLVAFSGMMQRFLTPVNNLINLGSDLQEMEGNLNRLDDVLDNPIDSLLTQENVLNKSSQAPHPLASFVRIKGNIELDNITFGYSRIDPPLIENFSLKLKKGQRVALVGASGCGKSTIAKLICGLYEPWSGEILFDGEPRRQIPRSVLANSISAVEQEIMLFAGSVRDNLTLWDTTVPNSSLVKASIDAALHDVILSLPGGFNADLKEGAINLSGGQRQRLEIARALVNNPTILVMDEATSALDAETEKIVADNLRLRGCTCIIVAHRLSTIRDCDLIIVLEAGKIVQQGTDEELQNVDGPYKQLLHSEVEATHLHADIKFRPEAKQNSNSLLSVEHSVFDQTDPDARTAIEIFNGKALKIPGQYYSLQINEPLVLNNLPMIWIAKSGSLALFAKVLTDSISDTSRRYLSSTKVGQAMFFPALTLPESKRVQILGISAEQTELLRVSVKDFSQFFVDVKNEAVTGIEAWIEQLGAAGASIAAPAISPSLSRSGYLSLTKDQIFQPGEGNVLWVKIQQGQVKWMGFEELILTPASVILPLCASMWLQAENEVEFEYVNTIDIQDISSIINGLDQLFSFFLKSTEILQQREIDAELIRFEQREELDLLAMEETLNGLASVVPTSSFSGVGNKRLGFSQDSSIAPEAALLVAAGAVGHTLEITIRPIAKSENLNRVQNPIEALARASRIRVRQIALPTGWWKTDCGAMLAYMHEDNYPVALLPVSNTRYELFDPRQHTRTTVNARTAAMLASSAIVFYRPLPEKVKALNLLAFALLGHYKEILVVLLTGIAVTLLGMLTPQATAILIDTAIPDANRGLLVQIALGLVAASFGAMMFQLAQGLTIVRLETFADSSTSAAVWDRLLNLKAAFFHGYSVGDLNSRITAVSQIRRQLSSTVLKTIFSSLFSLLNLGLLIYYSPQLALVACLVALVNVALTIVSGILTIGKVRPLLEREGQISGVMVQLINSVAKLRVAKAEARAFAYWGKQYTEQLKLMLSTQGIEDFLAVSNQILPALTTAALFWFATSLIPNSPTPSGVGLSIGTFLAFNVAFGTFITAVTSLSSSIVVILQVLPLWQRAEPILLAQPEVNFSQADPGRLLGKLVVERVTFRYRDDGPLILDNISIHADRGEFIAIVGASGSGKSTLLRLLLGFEVPQSGTIYYDGQDLARLDVYAVRRQLGVVLQNSRLMSASILDNIAGGALITLDEAWSAAQMAGLANDIAAMPMGIHTVVSEGGSNLSGGQRQRLFIARALVLKPQILLLDEATSALDNKTQAIVTQSLKQLQVTRVAIAHRLSTIRHADRIYVLSEGKVVQQGSFQQLAAEPGLFMQLMARQML